MVVPQEWMVSSGKLPIFQWMMTGGTPMTKRKSPRLDHPKMVFVDPIPEVDRCVDSFPEEGYGVLHA